jgi:hypothetical protein
MFLRTGQLGLRKISVGQLLDVFLLQYALGIGALLITPNHRTSEPT